jgi:hypothetical protein
VPDRKERCNTPVSISVGVEVLFLTEVLNFLFHRKDLISLIVLPKSLISGSHITNQGAMQCQRFFDIREYLNSGQIMVKA